jgi:hypothetical protein
MACDGVIDKELKKILFRAIDEATSILFRAIDEATSEYPADKDSIVATAHDAIIHDWPRLTKANKLAEAGNSHVTAILSGYEMLAETARNQEDFRMLAMAFAKDAKKHTVNLKAALEAFEGKGGNEALLLVL